MKIYFFLFYAFFFNLSNAQTIIGSWDTFDDKTNERLSVVEIYNENNRYFGRITNLYKDPLNSVCEECKGKNKNTPVIGLVILKNLRKDNTEYNEGTILDPKNGETYKCTIELVTNNKLKLRGYIGFSLFGRTQYWKRKK